MNLAGLLVNLWLTPLIAGSPMLVSLLPSSRSVYILVPSLQSCVEPFYSVHIAALAGQLQSSISCLYGDPQQE